MHALKKKFNDELYMYEEKAMKNPDAKVSDAELNRIHTLSDTVKNFCKIDTLEEGSGYSEESNWMADGRMYGTSYARGRGDNAKRDRMGRYSRDGGYAEEGRGGSNRGYSYGGYSYKDKDDMLEHLHEMMGEASTTKEREAIKRCIREMEDD
jgi:hypothetical protein